LLVPEPPPAPPPVPRENIAATTAVIGWNPPADANGVIISYTVNIVAVSLLNEVTSQKRRRKREMTEMMTFEECAARMGRQVDSNETVPGNTTNLTVNNLGKLE